MNIRPATAVTALAIAVVTTTSLTACGSGDDASASKSGPRTSPVAAVAQETSPLAPGDVHASFEGAFGGTFNKHFAAKCGRNDEYRLTLTGDVNGTGTVIELSNLGYEQPGQVQLRDSGITADVAQSDVRKDWRNQGIADGEGTVTYNPDGTTGSFDITLPEISYDTAATLPNNPKLHLAGRWSCGAGGSSS